MDKKILIKSCAVLGLSVFLMTQFSIGQAHASWGAARLVELRAQQNATPPVPTNPPVIPEPEPEPELEKPPVTQPDPQPQPPEISEPTQPDEEQEQPTGMSQEELLMLQMVNEAREKQGLKPLQPMAKLNELARLKSQDIIDNNYFSHTSPTYGSFANMVYDAGIRFYSVGENLAKARNAKHAYYLFMASSGHKANILSTNFTHVGIGVVPYKYGVVVTQLFVMQ